MILSVCNYSPKDPYPIDSITLLIIDEWLYFIFICLLRPYTVLTVVCHPKQYAQLLDFVVLLFLYAEGKILLGYRFWIYCQNLMVAEKFYGKNIMLCPLKA